MSVMRCFTFTVGELLLGIDVDRVREVLIGPAVTPVPFAAPEVRGLLNRRGEILAVLDAHRRLGIDPSSEEPGEVHAIVELAGETVSLAVDAEGEVLEFDAVRLEPVPATVPLALRRRLGGLVELDDGRVMLMLRTESAIAAAAA